MANPILKSVVFGLCELCKLLILAHTHKSNELMIKGADNVFQSLNKELNNK